MSDKDLNRNDVNDRDGDANRDPISGAPGSHPVGTGLGAAAGGAAAGVAGAAIAGAATGAAMTGPAAPVGAAIGAVIGAGAGAGSVYVQGREDIELLSGSELSIRASAANR